MNIVLLLLGIHWPVELPLSLPLCYVMSIQAFTVIPTVHPAVCSGLFAFHTLFIQALVVSIFMQANWLSQDQKLHFRCVHVSHQKIHLSISTRHAKKVTP